MTDIAAIADRLSEAAAVFAVSGRERDRDELHAARRAILEAFEAAVTAERARCADIADMIDQPGIPGTAEWLKLGNFAGAIRDAILSTEPPCTCHPSDNPPVPCAKKYALSECIEAASLSALVEREAELVKAMEPFADIADTEDEVGREDPTDDRVWVSQAFGCQLAELTIDHFRRARALIHPKPKSAE